MRVEPILVSDVDSSADTSSVSHRYPDTLTVDQRDELLDYVCDRWGGINIDFIIEHNLSMQFLKLSPNLQKLLVDVYAELDFDAETVSELVSLMYLLALDTDRAEKAILKFDKSEIEIRIYVAIRYCGGCLDQFWRYMGEDISKIRAVLRSTAF